VDTGLLPGRLLPRFDSHDRGSVRIDLAEERELDFTRKEAVFLPGEGSASRSRDVALRDVAHEVAGDAQIEQELTRAPLLVQGEGLSRSRQVHRRRRPAETGRARGRARCGGAGRDGRRPGRGRRRHGLRFETLQPLGHRLELLLELLDLLPQLRGVLRRGNRRRQRCARRDEDQGQYAHPIPPV